jgi:hypothetical protein
MYIAHNYEEMTKEKRPQDDDLSGDGLTYVTSEHGGEYPDNMPQCVTVYDSKGRSCKYTPITVNGKVVEYISHLADPRENARVHFATADTPRAIACPSTNTKHG